MTLNNKLNWRKKLKQFGHYIEKQISLHKSSKACYVHNRVIIFKFMSLIRQLQVVSETSSDAIFGSREILKKFSKIICCRTN